MFTSSDHTFAVCAYKENPYLEETIKSLLAQNEPSKVIISTSTPNSHIKTIADIYDLELTVNPNPHYAGDDWNHAYNFCDTPLVTVAHQDDYYEPQFLTEVLKAYNSSTANDISISFTDYYELRDGVHVKKNLLLNIKRIMNFLYMFSSMNGSIFVKRRILAFGNPICCPAITYNKGILGNDIFDRTLKDSCDYKTLVDLAGRAGRFVYIPKAVLGHRIYADSATSRNLDEGIRRPENLKILSELWPKPVARVINYFYSKSEKFNNTF